MSEDKVRAGERLMEGGEAGRIGVGEDVDKRRNELSGEWMGKRRFQWGGRSGWRSYLGWLPEQQLE